MKNLYEAERNGLSSSIETVDSLTAQVTSALEFANQACDVTNPTQLLASQTQIINRLQELQNARLPVTTSFRNDVAFTAQHNLAMSQIQDSIQHLCEKAYRDVRRVDHTELYHSVPSCRIKPATRTV